MAPAAIRAESQDTTFLHEYQNPAIPGFAPDPSVVLVDGTYFLVTSSFHLFPGIPIYTSTDLKEWTHTGNAITRKSQVDLTDTITKAVPLHDGHTMIGAGGLFAPTIRYHNGTFYIICTNVMCEGADFAACNFYVTTDNIGDGEWSDPIEVELYGIDPSLFIDADGRAYVQGSWRLDTTEQPTSTIKQWEIDLGTGKRISEIREIWTGFSKIYTEGPHIYEKDSWFYLLVAEGGTFEHHHLSIARSRDIWGPYESCAHNPILTGEGKKEIVQDAGHGELFQDTHGQWWAAVLGVRKFGDGTRYPLGRETFLTPVSWPQGEWPTLEHPSPGRYTRLSATRPTKRLVNKVRAKRPLVSDCYIRSPVLEDYKNSVSHDQRRSIALRAIKTDLSVAIGTATFVGKRQRQLDCSSAFASLRVNDATTSQFADDGVRAGLAVYKDDFRHASVCFDFATSTIVLSLRNNTPEDRVVGSLPVRRFVQTISFRLQASMETYKFAYRLGAASEWATLGSIDTRELTARDFTGTVFGVYGCQRTGEEYNRHWVTFDNFEVDDGKSDKEGEEV